MSEKNNISYLFDASGNLTLHAMERYLHNELSKAEKALVEEHIAESEFDRDALEGLKDHITGNLSKEINDLNTDILSAARKRGGTGIMRKSGRSYWYAAAGLVVLISLSALVFFMFRSSVEKPQLAINQTEKITDTTTVATGLKENSRIAEKINAPEVKSYSRIEENVDSEPEKSVSETEDKPQTNQQDSDMKFVEPEKLITITNEDALADNDVISDESRIAGVVITEEQDVTRENINMMEEKLPINYEIQSKNAIAAYEAVSPEEQSEDQVFMVVEQMPEYPGGEKALYQFLSDSIHYPDSAKLAGIQGKVYVSFIVNRDGSVTNARVLRGIGGGCDEEALRVIKLMPNWKPGQQRGKPVEVQYSLPVKFSLGN
jgi:TonB family protein